MVRGVLRRLDMLRTICSTRFGFSSREEPAPLHLLRSFLGVFFPMTSMESERSREANEADEIAHTREG